MARNHKESVSEVEWKLHEEIYLEVMKKRQLSGTVLEPEKTDELKLRPDELHEIGRYSTVLK